MLKWLIYKNKDYNILFVVTSRSWLMSGIKNSLHVSNLNINKHNKHK